WLNNNNHNKLNPKDNKEEVSVEEEKEEVIKTEDQDNPEIERKTNKNGSQSPNSVDLLKLDFWKTSSISSDSLSQSRNKKSLILSSPELLKNKLWKLNQSKNKPKPVKEPDLKPLLLSVMKDNTSD